MTLADELERLLDEDAELSADELYERLGRHQSKVRGADVVAHVLRDNPERFEEDHQGRFSSRRRTPAKRQPTEPTHSSTAWRSLELELREQLRGRRMVSEIGLDAKLLSEVESGLEHLVRRTPKPTDLARRVPALVAVYLVGHGLYRYEAGNYWSGFGIPGVDQSWGSAFRLAVDQLGLETFDVMVANDNAARYVAPILAHGGVPKYCLDDFFSLVNHGLNRGAQDATDLMTHWRTRRSAFAGIDKPVRRFLLFGGAPAKDFLDRCIDVIEQWSDTATIPGPADAGLPAYVLSAFRKLSAAGAVPKRASNDRRSHGIRPTLLCDPWDLAGPTIVLPKTPGLSPAAVWTISTPNGVQRERVSAHADKHVAVAPAREWEVRLTADQQVMSEVTFEGLDTMPALFFDTGSYHHAPPGLGIRGTDILVLRPADKELMAQMPDSASPTAARVVDELPLPTGAWSGFRYERIDLEGCSTLLVGSATEQRRINVSATQGAALRGDILEGVWTSHGSGVYSGSLAVTLPNPEISWSVRLTVDGSTSHLQSPGGRELDLVGLLPDDRAARVSLTARGALGSDLRTTLTWIPQLTVTRPDRLALPHEPPPTVQIASPAVPPLGADGGPTWTLRADDDSDTVDLLFPAHGESVDVRVHVPRLMWGSISDGHGLGAAPLHLSCLDFAGSPAPGLAVTTGLSSLPVAVELSQRGEALQRSDRARSAGRTGQCRFDLAVFTDTISQLDERADLLLLVGTAGVPVRIGSVSPDFEISDLHADATHFGSQAVVVVEFTERRKVRGRALRLWPVHRPWDEPTVQPIPDDAVGRIEVYFDPAPAPGRYLVEVAVDDGWLEPVRPRGHSSAVVTLDLGDEAAARSDLSARAEHDPTAVVESVLATGRSPRRLCGDELDQAVLPALHSWAYLTLDSDHQRSLDRSVGTLLGLLASGRWSLPDAIDELAGDDIVSPSDLLRLTVHLGSRLHPHNGRELRSSIRSVWQLEPALASLLELGVDEAAVSDRPSEFLGWAPPDGLSSISEGEPIQQQWLGMELDQLDQIRSFLQFDLLPRPLTVDGGVEATLEWLRADKQGGGGLVRTWCSAHHGLARRPIPTSEHARRFLDARAAPPNTESWSQFPMLTLAGALHVIGGTERDAGTRALTDAVAFAPLQVRRDLVLARLLVIEMLDHHELDDLPTGLLK